MDTTVTRVTFGFDPNKHEDREITIRGIDKQYGIMFDIRMNGRTDCHNLSIERATEIRDALTLALEEVENAPVEVKRAGWTFTMPNDGTNWEDYSLVTLLSKCIKAEDNR